MAASSSVSALVDDLGSAFVAIVAGKVNNDNKKYWVHKKLLFSRCSNVHTKLQPASHGGLEEQVLWSEEEMEVVKLLVEYLYKDIIPTFEVAMSKGSNSMSAFGTYSKPPPIFDLPSLNFYPRPDNENLHTDVDAPAWLLEYFENEDNKQMPGLQQRRNWRKLYEKIFERQPIQLNGDIDLYQTNLLRLCILADKLEWSQLFNTTIRAYVEGEAILQRSDSHQLLSFIYRNTVAGSALRVMALDAATDGKSKIDMSIYRPLAQENADFLDDVLARLQAPKNGYESVLEATREGAYDMQEKEVVK